MFRRRHSYCMKNFISFIEGFLSAKVVSVELLYCSSPPTRKSGIRLWHVKSCMHKIYQKDRVNSEIRIYMHAHFHRKEDRTEILFTKRSYDRKTYFIFFLILFLPRNTTYGFLHKKINKYAIISYLVQRNIFS